MPTADSRSHSGCWTCRARRKKCDEGAMPCRTCTGLRLLCHGYGPRPAWMDGDVQEKTKVAEFKAAVRQNLKQRQKLKSVRRHEALSKDVIEVRSTCMTQEQQSTNLMITPTSPVRTSHVEFPSPSPCFDQAIDFTGDFAIGLSTLSCDIGNHVSLDPIDLSWDTSMDEETTAHPSDSSALTPRSPSLPLIAYGSQGNGEVARSDAATERFAIEEFCALTPVPNDPTTIVLVLSPHDVDTIHQYMAQTYETQFPFANQASVSSFTQQLMALSAQSRPCLAALGFHDLKRRSSALINLGLEPCESMKEQVNSYGDMTSDYQEATNKQPSECNEIGSVESLTSLETQVCVAQTLFSKVLNTDSTWPDQVEILATLAPINYKRLLHGKFHQLGSMQDLLVGIDILASTSTGRDPAFAMRFFQELGRENAGLEQVTGCTTEVMMSIMGISQLQAWKSQQVEQNCLSMIELARRALKLESALAEARETNASSLATTWKLPSQKSETSIVTNVFAWAAHVYLHAIVSGARPDIPEIKNGVTETISALKKIPRAELIKSLSWPICITACLADGEQMAFFKNLERGIEESYGKTQRVLRAFAVANECWKLRQSSGKDGQPYDWRDGMKSLNQIMVFL